MKRALVYGTLLLFCAGGIVFSFQYRQHSHVRLVVTDIGQGDAVLLQIPGNVQVLIDGGPNNTVVEKLGERLPYFDRTIEILILTHPDADHVVGLVEVLRRYTVEKVILTGVEHSLPAYQEFLSLLEQQEVKYHYARPGEQFVYPEVALSILGPEEDWRGKKPPEQNRESVSARLDVEGISFLFTGDADLEAEEELIRSGQNLHADVLKLGHHGSKTSTGEPFLNAVQPSVAIVSAGEDNQFGHPSPEVVERLERRGIEVLSTIDEGDICLEVREGELWRC